MVLAGTGSGTLAFVVVALLAYGVLVWQRRRMQEVTRRLEQRDEYRRPSAQAPGDDDGGEDDEPKPDAPP